MVDNKLGIRPRREDIITMRVPIEDQIKVISAIKQKVDITQNGRVIYITISGSDLYGFPSKDSDVDYRGTYITGTENLLGLSKKRDLIEMKPDIVMFELAKEINLAVKGNCNVLEHINAEPVYRTAESLELKRMVNNTFGKNGLYNSYRGMAMFNYKKFILRGKKTYKKYLYVFRGIMAGTYALQTGRIQPNIIELNKYFKLPLVKTLVKYKVEGVENEEVRGLADSGELDAMIMPLFEKMDKAYDKCKIQNKPDEDGVAEINSWLIEQRVGLIGS